MASGIDGTSNLVRPVPIITYGVWIEGQGWLKSTANPRLVFASAFREVALGAAGLWGRGASVRPIDQSLIDLEAEFLEQRKSSKGRWAWLTTPKC